ncbi:hypothetical protein [Motiliproteus coralliicola]|uniref:hypothetical protein n=1 Tax=Motiliproteus coralliicola TaxID=2283196 RepID=UPI001A9D9E2A|nr:hypothetical protein [Motiliproteus coralliicola]
MTLFNSLLKRLGVLLVLLFSFALGYNSAWADSSNPFGYTQLAHSHNPCAHKNPCAAKNPCAYNPCAAKNPCAANPCAAKNPCAHNPCAAKNPCAANPCAAKNPCAHNPCAAKNPCAANPCAAKNPCAHNPCAAKNPCTANPCAAKADSSQFVRPLGSKMYGGNEKGLMAAGKKLWSDTSLSTNGLSCATCHAGNQAFNATFKQPYPHPVAMASDRGVDQIHLEEMVQLCITTPMANRALPWDSKKLAALTEYSKKVQKQYQMAAVNPCAAKNPCAANPCAAKNPCAANPCAAKNPCAANPCAAKNPCAANPCAAKNPCAANPCAAKNPCAANPCAAKNPCGG